MPRLALIKRLFVLGVQSAHLAGLALTGGAREKSRLALSLPPSSRRRDVKTCQKTQRSLREP